MNLNQELPVRGRDERGNIFRVSEQANDHMLSYFTNYKDCMMERGRQLAEGNGWNDHASIKREIENAVSRWHYCASCAAEYIFAGFIEQTRYRRKISLNKITSFFSWLLYVVKFTEQNQ